MKPQESAPANIGNYHISSYSPGDRHGTRYSLEQMSNESGGVRTVLPTVCGSENFLDCLNALIEGMRHVYQPYRTSAKGWQRGHHSHRL